VKFKRKILHRASYKSERVKQFLKDRNYTNIHIVAVMWEKELRNSFHIHRSFSFLLFGDVFWAWECSASLAMTSSAPVLRAHYVCRMCGALPFRTGSEQAGVMRYAITMTVQWACERSCEGCCTFYPALKMPLNDDPRQSGFFPSRIHDVPQTL
jgi:hypothetical protein